VSGRVAVEAATAELAVPHSAGDHADAVRRSAWGTWCGNPVGGPVRPFGWFHTVASRQTSLRNTARPRRSPARRRRGRPLCPRSAFGRPLTA